MHAAGSGGSSNRKRGSGNTSVDRSMGGGAWLPWGDRSILSNDASPPFARRSLLAHRSRIVIPSFHHSPPNPSTLTHPSPHWKTTGEQQQSSGSHGVLRTAGGTERRHRLEGARPDGELLGRQGPAECAQDEPGYVRSVGERSGVCVCVGGLLGSSRDRSAWQTTIRPPAPTPTQPTTIDPPSFIHPSL